MSRKKLFASRDDEREKPGITITTLFFAAVLFACCVVPNVYANDIKSETESENILLAAVASAIITRDAVSRYEYDGPITPAGAAPFLTFEKEYTDHVKFLPIEYRTKYFWVGMWHMQFDGYFMEQFQNIAYNDCGDEFIRQIELFLAKENETGYNETKVSIAKKVLAGLKAIEAHHQRRK